MRTSGLGRLRRSIRRVFRRPKPGILILLYHRVTTLASDPFRLAVTPDHFKEHLSVIRRNYPVAGLPDAVKGVENGSVAGRTIVITFDDGYEDVFHAAQPLLQQHSMPATVFVASGYVGASREPWWDELEKACLEPDHLPGALTLEIGRTEFSWKNPEVSKARNLLRERHDPWDMYQGHDIRGGEQLFRILYRPLKALPTDERDIVLGKLCSWAGVGQEGRETHRMLREDTIRRIAEGGTIEIGAHTVHHPPLSTLPLAVQGREIMDSKLSLERMTGKAVTTFAYPYGGETDFTAETTSLVKQAGFSCACSNIGGIVDERSDLFSLPRHEVLDWDGQTFEKHLDDWWRG